ncbi:MAG: DUF2281 domain-containing protein [Methylovulum sp.]|uniref:DUF2281 domain-containing protein n=1 Tax=Methylovulum sp. TaxID=1916980 RepID=UPI00261107A0|nr:DUF2281 domain-containing protein [Methylovulum sp.]MDD2725293.1 DUF2281 domain-containing protein [Methylovulum sp.]MDD5125130.1 DUF2281 domain-containing protein [Methylovulum sp.]
MPYEKLKEKYQATAYSNEIACNPLSYILRKAEIGYNLSSIEWEWLEQRQLRKMIEMIQSQENYRSELRRAILTEQRQLLAKQIDEAKTKKIPKFGCAKGTFKMTDNFDAPLDGL